MSPESRASGFLGAISGHYDAAYDLRAERFDPILAEAWEALSRLPGGFREQFPHPHPDAHMRQIHDALNIPSIADILVWIDAISPDDALRGWREADRHAERFSGSPALHGAISEIDLTRVPTPTTFRGRPTVHELFVLYRF